MIVPAVAAQPALQRRTLIWVLTLGTIGLVFDGYDLVVYGAIIPGLLRDPSQIGALTLQLAGALGSYALIGFLVGALAAGAIGDRLGRRLVMLGSYPVLAIGMGLTALTTTTTSFGVLRFLTGIGVGALVATTGAMIAEVVPAGRRNFFTGMAYCGVAFGAVITALVAILVLGPFGWRAMFWIGLIPLFTLLPLAWMRMPESIPWLVTRGRIAEARAIAVRTGLPMPSLTVAPAVDGSGVRERSGFAGLLTRELLWATVLLGLTSMTSLMLVFSLNTWLPELMQRAGFRVNGSLAFLFVLNGASIVGALIALRLADRYGTAKAVAAFAFAVGAASALLLTLDLPVGVLFLLIGTIGFGSGGAQLLVLTYTATYYRTAVRGAGVAWGMGVGRLGAIGGPLLGGFLLGAGLPLETIFYVLAGIALLGMVLILLVPPARSTPSAEPPDGHDPTSSVGADAPAPPVPAA